MLVWTNNRDDQNDARTYGSLLRPDGVTRFGDMLELPWKNDAPEISCIPGNVLYFLDFAWSPDHEIPLFHYRDVRGRTACEQHSANIPAQLRGCSAPGYGRVPLMAIDGFAPQDGIACSREALDDFMTACGLPDFRTLTTEADVLAFVAAHPELAVIQMQVNDPPLLQAAA
jgi:hypothetical protein